MHVSTYFNGEKVVSIGMCRSCKVQHTLDPAYYPEPHRGEHDGTE